MMEVRGLVLYFDILSDKDRKKQKYSPSDQFPLRPFLSYL